MRQFHEEKVEHISLLNLCFSFKLPDFPANNQVKKMARSTGYKIWYQLIAGVSNSAKHSFSIMAFRLYFTFGIILGVCCNTVKLSCITTIMYPKLVYREEEVPTLTSRLCGKGKIGSKRGFKLR